MRKHMFTNSSSESLELKMNEEQLGSFIGAVFHF